MTSGGSTLDDVRHTLYAGPRATFVERRKELAGEARSGGDRDAAKLIGEMRKPTAAAHVVNLLAQSDDASLQDLVELGASIRRAMAEGDDPEVRAAAARSCRSALEDGGAGAQDRAREW